MTEKKVESKTSAKQEAIRPSTLLPYDQGFESPTPGEIREVIRTLGMSGTQVANFVGVSSGRTVRKWQAEDALNKNNIPYAAWRLLVERLNKEMQEPKNC